ncbi:MAG: response regulator [Deltaproteobacteria bacterium]|nr:response regulator [Deltaproteobacteria bacterium]
MSNGNKILVVDDEKQNVELLESILEDEDYEVDSAYNGEQAWEMLLGARKSYKVMLLDRMMPGISGTELIKMIRGNEELNNIKIILQTALSQNEDIAAGTEAGADRYLTKPLDDKVVLSMVKSCIMEYDRFRSVTDKAEKEVQDIREYAMIKFKSDASVIGEMQLSAEAGQRALEVVHEVKNITGAMEMDLKMFIIPTLKDILPDKEEAREILDSLIEATQNQERGTELLNSLLAGSRKDETTRPVELMLMIRKAINMLPAKLSGIDCQFLAEEGLKVLGSSQLIGVFSNLIANAADELKKSSIENPKIQILIEQSNPKCISTVIRDNGKGIAPEVLSKILKGKRVSTKGEDGNGYGLPLCKNKVESWGGSMEVHSRLGEGASFKINLVKA